MTGGLYPVYTSLLTIFVLSSCALFLLVVSDASLPNRASASDEATLSNVTVDSAKVGHDPEPKPTNELSDGPINEPPDKKTSIFADSELSFAGALSQNSVITDGLPDTGQPPILLSLADTAKLDLQDAPEKRSVFGNDSDAKDSLQPLVRNDNSSTPLVEETEAQPTAASETLVVFAKPMHEARLTDEAFGSSTPEPKIEQVETDNQNKTETQNVAATEDAPREDIPSFSEWAQKQLAEAEKQDTVLNHSSQPSHSATGLNNKSTKLRSKNYASPACGAKVVAVNPEAGSASAILSPNKDEYMLNTCTSRIWFVVELCEPLQAQKIELANFELFSSSPKDFAVYFSDRFPTREWTSVGHFSAKNDKEVQSFDLFPHLFGKFIKVEMLSHHGSEHYCPVSLFKVYGTSEFEVLEKENSQHANAQQDEDDDEILGDLPDAAAADAEGTKNLFGSARDAVMSIMKKAAQVLVKSEDPKNCTDPRGDSETLESYKTCCSPSHIIVCDNCSDVLYNAVFDLISCSSNRLSNVINKLFVQETLRNTEICLKYGLDFKNKRTISFRNERASYMTAVFSENYIAALCNFLAIIDKKVVLNTSYETELNVTSNLTLDKVSNIVVDESNVHEIVQIPFKDKIPDEKDILNKDRIIVPDPTFLGKEKDNQDEEKNKDTDPAQENNSPIQPTTDVKVDENDKVEAGVTDKHPKEMVNVPVTEKIEQVTEKTDQKPDNNNGKSDRASDDKVDPIAIDNKTQNIPHVVEEINDQLVIDTDSFLSDLDQLISDPTIQTTATPNMNNQGQPPQKESVFLRLSNRVKTLERNMSLSAQYLEELSKRYKKQVEEMQRSFDKTLLQMSEERKRNEERDQQNMKQMSVLHEQLSQLNAVMLVLLDERDSWFGNITFLKLAIFQTIVIAVLYYINRRRTLAPASMPTSRKTSKSKKNQVKKLRRKSVEGVSGHKTPASKRRRPSEEALQIERHSAQDFVPDPDPDSAGQWQVARKNRRRKTSIVHRVPVCNPAVPDWKRQDSIGVLRENAIPLDEEEFIAPVSEPIEFPEIVEPPMIKKGYTKTNGSIFSIKGASKAVKSRRLSSPAFFRTALSRQSSRSTPSPMVEPPNGKPEEQDTQAASESPCPSLCSYTPGVSLLKNGACTSESGSVKQTKKRSFKNIFRKVF